MNLDPVTAAVIEWVVSTAGTAGLGGLGHLLQRDKQQNALRAVVSNAIGSAVEVVVAEDDRNAVREALLESPESAEVQTKDVLELREAVLRQIEPRLRALAGQGYEIDAAHFATVLAKRIEAGIRSDAMRGGPLKPLEDLLRHERVAAAGEETVQQLKAVNRTLGTLAAPAPGPAALRQPAAQLIGDLAGPMALGVHKAIDARVADLPDLPPYVRRGHDELLRQIIEKAGQQSAMTVLVGDSSTGKTRALWEAISHLPEQWRLWSPADARALNIGLADDAIAPRTVVWINDAHNYLDPQLSDLAEDNAARLLELIGGPGGPVLIAATLWPTSWQQLTAQPRDNPASGQQGIRARGSAQVASLLANAKYIAVPESFQGAALEAISAAAGQDPRLSLALKQAARGRITQYLAGAPKLLERYDTAPPQARALIDAAIDARRLGYANRLPERLLAEAAAGYIDEDAWDRLGDDWAAQALRDVSEDWRGLPGPLTRIKPRPGEPVPGRPEYRLADVLEQHGARTRCRIAPPERFWTAAARNGSSADLTTIGEAAKRRGRYRHAAAFYLKAAEAGDTGAMWSLTRILERAGDHAGAERLYRQAADAGDARALKRLVAQREEVGDRAGAERLYRQAAADAGDTNALKALVRQRLRAGDHASAEQLAARAGDTWALQYLAVQREKAGDHDQAEQLLVLAAEAGDTGALMRLAEIREKAGDHAGAEQLAVRAADAGDTEPLVWLAKLREEAGDRAGAEQLCRQVADVGDTEALVRLAALLEEAGDHDRAAQLYQQAIDADADDGGPQWAEMAPLWAQMVGSLARLREEAGDHAGAEQLADRAAAAGDTSPLKILAALREQAGDLDGAEQLIWQAARAGDTEVLVSLAEMREEAGDQAGAEQMYRLVNFADNYALGRLVEMREQDGDHTGAEQLAGRAAEAGDTGVMWTLAELREAAGDRAGAEQLYRQAADAGGTWALEKLAEMREQAGDRAGAEQLYRQAADAGDTWVLDPLENLARLREKAGDHAGAEQLRRYGLDACGSIAAPWTIEIADR